MFRLDFPTSFLNSETRQTTRVDGTSQTMVRLRERKKIKSEKCKLATSPKHNGVSVFVSSLGLKRSKMWRNPKV